MLYRNDFLLIPIDYKNLSYERIQKNCVGKIRSYPDVNIVDLIEELKFKKKDSILKYESILHPSTLRNPPCVQPRGGTVILPVNKNPLIKNFMRHAFPLSVIDTSRHYIAENIVLNDYIDLIAVPHIPHLDYHNYGYLNWENIKGSKIYPEILEANQTDIAAFIINSLRAGYYADIWMDAYYIPGKPAYGSEHMTHGFLIYGYSHEKNVFLSMTYTNTAYYQSLDIAPENLACACMNLYFTSITLFQRIDAVKVDYDIQKISRRLSHYIQSTGRDLDGVKANKEYPGTCYLYGLNASLWFEEQLRREADDRFHMVRVYTFAEHKKCMAWRISEITQRERIPIEVQNEAAAQHSSCDALIKLCLKFNLTKKRLIADRALQVTGEILERETMLLERLQKTHAFFEYKSTSFKPSS